MFIIINASRSSKITRASTFTWLVALRVLPTACVSLRHTEWEIWKRKIRTSNEGTNSERREKKIKRRMDVSPVPPYTNHTYVRELLRVSHSTRVKPSRSSSANGRKRRQRKKHGIIFRTLNRLFLSRTQTTTMRSLLTVERALVSEMPCVSAFVLAVGVDFVVFFLFSSIEKHWYLRLCFIFFIRKK